MRSWILAAREPRIGRAKILQTLIVICFLVPVFWQLNNYNGYNPDGKISREYDITNNDEITPN
jgi:hypothetical protein